MRIAEYLDLDVAWPLEVLLDVDGVIAERLRRLSARRIERLGQVLRRAHHAHPSSAAAGRGLEQHGVPNLLRDGCAMTGIAQWLDRPRNDGHIGSRRERAGRGLGAHGLDRLCRWSDEHEPGLAHGARERCPLGQESVSGVHRIGAGLLRGVDQPINGEIAL